MSNAQQFFWYSKLRAAAKREILEEIERGEGRRSDQGLAGLETGCVERDGGEEQVEPGVVVLTSENGKNEVNQRVKILISTPNKNINCKVKIRI